VAVTCAHAKPDAACSSVGWTRQRRGPGRGRRPPAGPWSGIGRGLIPAGAGRTASPARPPVLVGAVVEDLQDLDEPERGPETAKDRELVGVDLWHAAMMPVVLPGRPLPPHVPPVARATGCLALGNGADQDGTPAGGEPQPSSRAGGSRNGVEVRAMNMIAAKVLRSGMTRCRPPYGGWGGAGSNGSTIVHSWSGTRSSARVAMTWEPAISSRKERNDSLRDLSAGHRRQPRRMRYFSRQMP
jgi:hypothetical protein